MVRYFLNRLLLSIVAVLFLITVTFALVHLIPGGPFASEQGAPQIQEALERTYGLDRPLAVQYATYLGGLLRGNLGVSLKQPGVTAVSVIRSAAPLTLSLGGVSLLLAIVLGVLAGYADAALADKDQRRGRSGEGRKIFLLFYGLAGGVPSFAAAMLLLLVFSLWLPVFPATGLYSPVHYVLPALSLSLYPASVCARILASAMKKELAKPYVRALRSRGLSSFRILSRHVLRNAWLPVFGYISQAAAYLLTGSFAIEAIFNIPGLGREFVSAISGRDYTLVMGLVIYTGIVVIVAGLILDLIGAALDPQLRRTFAGEHEAKEAV